LSLLLVKYNYTRKTLALLRTTEHTLFKGHWGLSFVSFSPLHQILAYLALLSPQFSKLSPFEAKVNNFSFPEIQLASWTIGLV
jgi:hypothetical protein